MASSKFVKEVKFSSFVSVHDRSAIALGRLEELVACRDRFPFATASW